MKQALPWIITSICVGSVGQVLLKVAARDLGGVFGSEALGGALVRIALNPFVELGVVLFVTSMVLWIKALTLTSLASAYPMVAGGYVIVLAVSALFLKERISGGVLIGTVMICLGVLVLARSG